jgi:hypothetical protein
MRAIELFLKKSGPENAVDVDNLRQLFEKAQFYLGLLETAPEPATEVAPA